jgi:hypothetical protein
MWRTWIVAFRILFVFTVPCIVSAQSTTGIVLGSVTDATGAVLPGAMVSVRNIDTNITRMVETNEQGVFRIDFLPVGRYQLEVSFAGFKTYIRRSVELTVNQELRIDAKLEIGNVTEEVSVTDAPAVINTSNAEIGRTIEAAEITNLPLVDRNPYTLLDLTPGVQSNSSGVATAPSGSNALVLGFPEQRTFINGGVDGGAGSVNYYLDGGINMTGLRNTGNTMPNPDAIQEFRIQTNSYNAEYGRFASGVINAVTKSGTNDLHGTVAEYVRNTAFNANDWGSQLPIAPFHRNQFGGTVGGPVKRDRSFFFFSYAGLRQSTSTFLNNAVVPTALERSGDFSRSKTIPTDPATGQAFFCNGVTGAICSNRLDPVAAKIINTYIPQANVPGSIWQGYVPSPFDTDEFLIKFDHSINKAHSFTGGYFEYGGTNTVRAGTSGNLPWAQQRFDWRQHNLNLSHTWLIGSDRVNQLWLTYVRNFGGRLNLPQTSLADIGSAFTIQGAPSLPQITISGFMTLANAIGGPVAGTNLYSLRELYSWTKSRHALRFGAELSLDKDIQQTLLNNYGVFTFNGSVTKNALADFELGIPSGITQDAPVTGYTNSWYTASFIQDDYRIHPRLTLNLGLRWDIQTPPTDPQNRATTYIAGRKSIVNPLAPVGQIFYGDPGIERGVIPVRWHHVSPRVGLAWDPFGTGKTSIRAAAGVFYGSLSGNEWNTLTNFEPFAIRLAFSNTSTIVNSAGVPQGATLSNPYNGYSGGNPFPYKGAFISGGSIFGPSLNFQWPYTYQLNFSMQRQVTQNLALTGAYVGSLSHNLPFAQDVNYPVLTPTATSNGANILSRRANPAFGQVLLLQSNQTASYHSLQLTTQLRMTHHLAFNAFYVYSKTWDSSELQNNTTQGGAQDMNSLREERAVASTDQRHVFTAGIYYQPDYYTGGSSTLRNVINGWTLSPSIRLRSGVPITITNNGIDANLDGNTTTDRAQVIGTPHLSHPTAAQWFNTAAFAQNKAVTGVAVDGNSPRNFVYGPAYRGIDLAVARTFKVNERVKMTFRAEGTNVLNIVNLGQLGSTNDGIGNAVGSSTFGTIRVANPMRKLQFGLRLTY